MTKLRNILIVGRGLAALLVAHVFIRHGSGMLAQGAIDLYGSEVVAWEEGLTGLVGGIEVASTFALFDSRAVSRVIAAVLLLWSTLAAVAGVTQGSIPDWCIGLTAMLALLPTIPRIDLWDFGTLVVSPLGLLKPRRIDDNQDAGYVASTTVRA